MVMVSGRNAESPARGRIRVGAWIADPATNELHRGGESVRIEPKSMDVLMILAGRAGDVVSREELFAAVWPGTVVGDEALSQSITKLRRALGDDPRSPTYIETISKRGYRLTAPVGGDEPPPAPSAAQRRPRPYKLLLLGLALVAAVALLLHFSRDATPPAGADAANDRQAAWITVTVLPFESMGGNGAPDYFARGIGDALMTELGRLSGLRVISAAGIAPGQAAQRARYMVSGSVQREGGLLRINVRLTDARTNEQLWSERFERSATDLFAVQDEIIRKLAESLPAKVTASERQRLAKRNTRSLEAYDYFLRAQALFLARGARENRDAREFYRKAVEIDPQFSRAYAGLAMTYAMEPRLRRGTDAAPGLERALALAETARQIDPDIAEVRWALGFVYTQARRYPEAIESLQRATEINPSFADAYALLGGIHTYMGESAKSIPLLRTAMRLEPEGGSLYFLLLGRAYFFEGDFEQALINLRAALARNPADLEAHIYLAAALMASGNRSAAEWEAQEIRSLEPGFSLRRWLESYPLSSAPYRESLRRPLSEILPQAP
jgi:DNA-binding winged helix-turn-helix (wHTH) protein/TolB-like protein/cytochrome c-type biogenesis protein CcmH/NrfG